MKKKFLLLATLIFGSLWSADAQTTLGLKDYYKNYFPIGVAVSAKNIMSSDTSFILTQFNSLTPENAMKMGPIHPKENEYNFTEADAIVNFAQRHHLKVRGHNLCWHEQTPDWIFKDKDGKLVSKTELLKRLKEHIFTVVNRYKGKVYAWDVVNEAIDDDSTHFLRNSLWFKICGIDYIIKAFEYAHEADPNAILFYNDYNTERPEKRERVLQLIKKLQSLHVPVMAVGLQGHWSIYEPTQHELQSTIQSFAALGLQVQITELDISIYPWEKNVRKKTDKDIDIYTTTIENKQAEQYKMVFDVFRKNKKYITGVTFWNITDKVTWLDHYPVPGRKNYPLLFDADYQPKKAYWDVIHF
ncbi:MAG: endo-1,4-beta-xylanase [Sphingobacteriales bacterium]|uniref:endo-1,4-beta-xylanase n=1 Tax=Hydrotalea flava TaxID=714549 RepID=UPI00082C093D|nr:endo-1,4-beta-xylanase [Hydrotalea flava]RTL55919.1 MAG: endo-1,4-beta-xylanase [Sphingobacteriales bacterium]